MKTMKLLKNVSLDLKNNGWIKEVKGSWVVLKTQVINKNDEKIEIVNEMIDSLLEDFKNSVKSE